MIIHDKGRAILTGEAAQKQTVGKHGAAVFFFFPVLEYADASLQKFGSHRSQRPPQGKAVVGNGVKVCQEEVAAFLEEQNSVDAEEVFLRKEKKEFMYMVLRRFRKKQPINYEILIQVKYLEISVETVAEEYGLTKSGVNNRIYKAKRWLQEEFRKVYE